MKGCGFDKSHMGVASLFATSMEESIVPYGDEEKNLCLQEKSSARSYTPQGFKVNGLRKFNPLTLSLEPCPSYVDPLNPPALADGSPVSIYRQ
jgi:hypothetical protein